MGIIDKILSFFSFRESPESLTKKGKALAAKDNVMGAVESYKKALEFAPLHIPAYDGLGRVYFRMGMRDEADREFAIADGLDKLKNDPLDREAAVKMGRAMMTKGMHKFAVPYLEPIHKKNPHDPEVLKALGLCYKSMGNDRKAAEFFRAGIRKAPNDPDFYLHLGGLENNLGNKKEGERLNEIARLMAKCVADRLDAESRYRLARLFYAGNKFNVAAEYLRQAVAIEGRNADFWFFLGQCYYKAGSQPAAVDALKQSVKFAPINPEPQKLLALVYQHMGRFEDSRSAKQVADVLEKGQSNASTPQHAARFIKHLLSLGMKEDAGAKLDLFREQWPDSLELKMIHGRLLVRDNKHQEAIEVLRSVVQIKDAWAEPHIWLAVAYQRTGDNMSALAEGQLATRLAPKSHVVHRIFGDILREQKKFSMAENAYETAEHLRASKKISK